VEILAAHEIHHRSPDMIREAVEQAKTGDSNALDFLYVRFADDVRDEMRQILGDFRAAEDLTQSLFARLRTPLQWYEGAEAPFEIWMLRLARNAALDRHHTGRAAV
jgi:DNA-directed RNA polymerase specialized sigma24 family protein